MKLPLLAGLLSLTLLSSARGQIFSQKGFPNQSDVSPIEKNNSDLPFPKRTDGKKVQQFEQVSDESDPSKSGRKSEKNFRQVEGGVVNGGGGVSARDPVTGQRRLLDLIEKDEVDPFIPDFKSNELFLEGDPKHYGSWINAALVDFNRQKMQAPSPSSLLTMDPEEKIAEAPFLYALMRVLDNNNIWDIDANGVYFSNAGIGNPYRFKKFSCTFEEPTLLKWAFTDTDLAELQDEGQISYENEKTKKQVATQLNGYVVINRKEYQKLDKKSKTALFLHEAVLRTVLILNPDNIAQRGTQDVRTMNRRLFRFFSERSYPAYPVLEAYQALGISSDVQCQLISLKNRLN